MEQTPSSPGRSPELPSVSPPLSQEVGGGFSHAEVLTGSASERQEQREAAMPQTSAPIMAPPIVAPIVTAPADDASTTPAIAGVLPTVANDDDLIEKEWVDKAKKVIAETKDDPYRREQEVSRLQVDYLAKRYGRQLGPPQ